MPGGFFGLLEQEQVVPLQNCSQDSLTWDLAGRGSGHGKNLMANPAAYSGLRWGELIAGSAASSPLEHVDMQNPTAWSH